MSIAADPDAEAVMAAVTTRLRQIVPIIVSDSNRADALGVMSGGALLAEIARDVRASGRDDHVWLLLVAVCGAFPNADQVKMMRRALKLAGEGGELRSVLTVAFDLATRFGLVDVGMEIIRGGVVVDVDFCANHTHNTGIQRVVRQTMSRWHDYRDVTLVAWSAQGAAMRNLSPLERSRVVAWNSYTEPTGNASGEDPPRYHIVVPFESKVILPEVPQIELCNALASLAEFSGNQVGLIGFDTIPIVSADTVPSAETERFVRYLTIVKNSHRVAGISEAAANDFRGFSDAIASQGLGPIEVVNVTLPVDLPDLERLPHVPQNAAPLILCVGSQEPRKNQEAVLFAAELLWREGLKFRLRFIGGGSLWFTRGFDKQISRLRKAGRDVEVLRGVKDEALLLSYAEAEFSIFPSLHEGYGLPVAESLAMGVPVVTSEYASTAEIARDGGCVLIDPRNDNSIASAMRDLIRRPERVEKLRSEIAARPPRTWDNYAAELWDQLVAPLEGSPRG